MRRSLLAAVVLMASLLMASAAGAVTPGVDGLIAYPRLVGEGHDIALINQDGSGKTSLGSGAFEPTAWSPDGRRLLFFDSDGIAVLDVTTGQRIHLGAVPPEIAAAPVAWTPDGTAIVGVGNDQTGNVTGPPVVVRWSPVVDGAVPTVTSYPGVQRRVLDADLSPRDASFAVLQDFEQGDDVAEGLFFTPATAPFAGSPAAIGQFDGVSYAPDGSAVLSNDSGPERVRIDSPSGTVTHLPNPPGFVVFSRPQYMPSGRAIAFRLDFDHGDFHLARFTPTVAAANDVSLVPNTEDANGPAVVQPVAVSALDVHPVLLRLKGLSLGLLQFSARLTDRFGPVTGANVAFSPKGAATGCTATTDAQGTASCTVTLPWVQALLALGVTARYAGDITHTAASGSAGLIG